LICRLCNLDPPFAVPMLTELNKVKVQDSGRSMHNRQIRHLSMYLHLPPVHESSNIYSCIMCKRLTGVSSFYVDFLISLYVGILICFPYIWFLVICQNVKEGVISKGVLTATSKFRFCCHALDGVFVISIL
jgi:hypothetical protein